MRTSHSTPSTDASDYARLNCRVSSRIKHQAEEAAAILGQSITDFTETALAQHAQAVFERHERLTLSERDFALFVASLDNPEPPTAKLRSAVTEYHRLKVSHPDGNL